MPVVLVGLVGLAALFFAVVGYMVTRGMLAAWEATIGGLLQWMHDNLSFRIAMRHLGAIHVDFGAPFGAANHFMVRKLQHWADRQEWAIGVLWHGLAELAHWTLRVIDGTFKESLRWAHWQQHVFVPAFVHAVTHPLATALRALHVTTTQTASATHTVTRVVHTFTRTIEHTVTRVVVKAVPAAVPGAVALPGLLVNWRGLTRRMARLERRLAKAEAWAGATALALAMGNVLGVRARCLRGRGPIARVARGLCGLGPRALEDLLGLLVDVLIVEDICKVLPLLSQGFSLIEPELTAFIGVADGALCHGDYAAPPALSLPRLSRPPVAGVTLSLG